jgi:hypothetical protein
MAQYLTLELGDRVRITQQIPRLAGVWTTQVEGEVVRLERAKTGASYAHAKDHHLWLERAHLRKDDGEIVVINLDGYTHVDRLSDPTGSAPNAGPAAQGG